MTRCPTARTRQLDAVWEARRLSPSLPTRRSPIPCSSSRKATIPRPARSGTTAWSVSVKPAGSDAVLNGFIGKWPAELGGQPALWIPGSSISAARLAVATVRSRSPTARSLVTSPVVLAVRPELGQAWPTRLGGTARSANQPELIGRAELAGVGIAATGAADERQRRRSFLAGEAVAAASAPAGAPATQGIGAARTLLSAQPKLADNSLTEAMNTLLKPGDAATAPVHAVITTEQQAVPARPVAVRCQEHAGFLATARARAGRRLSHGAAQRLVADAGADLGGQRVRPLHAQARPTRQAGHGRLPGQRSQTAEQPGHHFPSAAIHAVGG